MQTWFYRLPNTIVSESNKLKQISKQTKTKAFLGLSKLQGVIYKDMTALHNIYAKYKQALRDRPWIISV